MAEIVVTNNITFINGKVTTSSGNTLSVTNPNPESVSYGNSSSYIVGTLLAQLKRV